MPVPVVAEQAQRAAGHLGERGRLQAALVVARELQQVADDLGDALAFLGDHRRVDVGVVAVVDQLRAVDDRVDRVVDLVGDARGEFADRRQPLALRQLGLQLLALGDVAQHGGEEALAAEPSFADGQVDRELAAVLAAADDLAADADHAAFAGLQVATEVAVVLGAVGGRHQHLDVVAEQLGARVAEQPERCLVDRLDRAAHVDRDAAFGHRRDDRLPVGGLAVARRVGRRRGGDGRERAPVRRPRRDRRRRQGRSARGHGELPVHAGRRGGGSGRAAEQRGHAQLDPAAGAGRGGAVVGRGRGHSGRQAGLHSACQGRSPWPASPSATHIGPSRAEPCAGHTSGLRPTAPWPASF